jgi:hypothetical protein
MRRMPAAIEQGARDRSADLPCDGVDLCTRAVLIVFTLDQQHRDRDAQQILFDVSRRGNSGRSHASFQP